MAAKVEIPCVELPELPELPNITLIGGIQLNGFLDMSVGMATDCTVTMNLMQQLAPALAGLVPILNILAVIKALADFATNPLVNGPDLIIAIDKIASLFVSLTPAGIAVTIKGVLELIIKFLKCFIIQLESAVSFQVELDLIQQQIELDPLMANAVLEASLSCARINAKLTMDHTMASLGPVAPLLDVVNIVAGIAGLSIEVPPMSAEAGADPTELVSTLKETITSLEQAIEALPL